jgi:hypothetical protein
MSREFDEEMRRLPPWLQREVRLLFEEARSALDAKLEKFNDELDRILGAAKATVETERARLRALDAAERAERNLDARLH